MSTVHSHPVHRTGAALAGAALVLGACAASADGRPRQHRADPGPRPRRLTGRWRARRSRPVPGARRHPGLRRGHALRAAPGRAARPPAPGARARSRGPWRGADLDDGQPRVRDHRARHPEAKELEVAEPALPLPHLTRGAGRPRRRRGRRGHDGEQPRCRLRRRRPAATPCAAIRNGAVPVVGIGRDRRGGLHAVPGLGPGHRPRLPRRATLAAARGRAASGRPGRQRRASPPPTPPGRAPARRGPRGQPRGRRRGGLPALGRRAARPARPPAARTAARAGRRGRRRHRGQPRARAARVRVDRRTPTSTTAWGTSSGTTTTSPRPGCSGSHRGRRGRRRRLDAGPDRARTAARSRCRARRGTRPSPTGGASAAAPACAARPDAVARCRRTRRRSGRSGHALRAPDAVQPRTPGAPALARPALPPDDLRRLRRPPAHRRDGGPRGPRRRGHRRLPAAVRRALADPPDAAGRRLRGRRRPVDGGEQHLRATTAAASPGSDTWSAHAYGAAIDINPVQNPYLTGASVAPAGGTRFATVDRSAGSRASRRAIRREGRRGPRVRRASAGSGAGLGDVTGLPALLGLGQLSADGRGVVVAESPS